MAFHPGDPFTHVTVPRDVFDELIALWLGSRVPGTPMRDVSAWIFTFLEGERIYGPGAD